MRGVCTYCGAEAWAETIEVPVAVGGVRRYGMKICCEHCLGHFYVSNSVYDHGPTGDIPAMIKRAWERGLGASAETMITSNDLTT
jgi:hypothetical protein